MAPGQVAGGVTGGELGDSGKADHLTRQLRGVMGLNCRSRHPLAAWSGESARGWDCREVDGVRGDRLAGRPGLNESV